MRQNVWYLKLASLTHFGHYAFSMVRPSLYDLKAYFLGSLRVLVLLVFMSLIMSVWRFVERTYSGMSVIFPIGCQSVVCGIEYPQKTFLIKALGCS